MPFELTSAYVGIPIPANISAALEKAQNGLRAGVLVHPDAFCIELAYLGEQPDLILDKARAALRTLSVIPFHQKLEGVGTEGGQSPESVFAEAENGQGLKRLHRQVGGLMRDAGVDLPYQKFTPGVVLATMDELGQFDLREIMGFLSRRQGLELGPFVVSEIRMWAERMTDDGPALEVLETFEF